MKKRYLILFSFIVLFALFAACGEEAKENSAINGNAASASQLTGAESDTSAVVSVQEEIHVHSFETMANNDGTHTVRCTGEECKEEKTEKCSFTEDYVCTECHYQHEHVFDIVPLEDGTHNLVCNVEDCTFITQDNCTLNEEYVCTECGWAHEHVLEYTVSEDGITHSAACTYTDCCDYTEEGECAIEHLRCGTCGYEVDWQSKLKKAGCAGNWGEGTYYAMKQLPVYSIPDYTSEPIRYLEMDESFYIKKMYDGDDATYFVNENNELVSLMDIDFTMSTNRMDLRPAPSSKVVVTKSVENGNFWTKQGIYKIYDSYNDAIMDFYGVTWDYVKANWEYNSCAGTPYMPYYITDIRENGWNWQIFTRKGSIPYSISTHTDTEHASYYFE